MTASSPMSYFASKETSEQTLTDNKKPSQSSKAFEDAFKRHKRIAGEINSIIAYPTVVSKLNEWNEKQVMYAIRKDSGIKPPPVCPEILFVTGNGMRNRALKHMGRYLWQSGLASGPNVHYYDINKFVCHYVIDTHTRILEAFEKDGGELICFYGFDELIANPRPAMADWFDWPDIIINMLLDQINDYGNVKPVIFDMSQSTLQYISSRFDKMASYDVERIQIPYLKAGDMAEFIYSDLESYSYILSPAAKRKIHSLVERCYREKDIRLHSEGRLMWLIKQAIQDRQATRLKAEGQDKLSKRRVKTISKDDIPAQPVFMPSNIIFY